MIIFYDTNVYENFKKFTEKRNYFSCMSLESLLSQLPKSTMRYMKLRAGPYPYLPCGWQESSPGVITIAPDAALAEGSGAEHGKQSLEKKFTLGKNF